MGGPGAPAQSGGGVSFSCTLALGLALWLCYVLALLRHFYDSAIRVPQTQRVARDVAELQLPRLYFCPADRGHMEGFRWASFECQLSFKDEHRTCPARLQAFKGRTPEQFRGKLSGQRAILSEGEAPQESEEQGGECLEFGTHSIGVRREWSAAWNEVTLRAAFHPPSTVGYGDSLQEVELGYLPVVWALDEASPPEHFYYPLLRVPFFFNQGVQYAPGMTPGPINGVSTRMFLGREVDKGLTAAGESWYSYGAMQLAVTNASTPQSHFVGSPDESLERRLGVVHIVITLEDFEEFDFVVASAFHPLLAVVGQAAGLGALLAVMLLGTRRGGSTSHDLDSFKDPSGGPEYARVAAREDDEDSGEEAEALLGRYPQALRKTSSSSQGEGRPQQSSQPLLNTEEGMDGL